MRLYIAEKPSVGRELARLLDAPHRRHDGYIETGSGIVTWVFGHILRQAQPEEYNERLKIWRMEDLPIIPEHWQLLVSESASKQFAIIKALIERATEIIHGGDPDREGQLLVDEVLDYLGNTKPVKRILINALDEKSIREALANLRDNRDFLSLKQSALARARADWLIGMNLSRAYTLAARRAGYTRLVLPIGRVKTPTLALVVRREREINNFQSVDYYRIDAGFRLADNEEAEEPITFKARLQLTDDMEGLDAEGRLVDKTAAERLLARLAEPPLTGRVASFTKKKKEESSPLPFSLSSLQVLAGKMYGYEPQLVLDTAQKLYEKKLTTYPRSDSEYLPENQRKDAAKIIANLAQLTDFELASFVGKADDKLRSRAWNDKKVTAHHAIIPTTIRPNLGQLTNVERNIYYLIARGYLAQFYPPYVYNQLKIELDYKDEIFIAHGRTNLEFGWRAMYQKDKEQSKSEDSEENVENGDSEDKTLPPLKKGDSVTYDKGELAAGKTKPPPRFTPATLLQGMKEIHKYVKNPEAKAKLKDVYGIGTEATRATIIEDLITRRFLKSEGKKKTLIPTDRAYLLIDALPDSMTYPDSTAIWEDKLHSLSEGEGSLEEFLSGQAEFARELVEAAHGVNISVQGDFPCPVCKNGQLLARKGKNGDFWGCSNFPRCRYTANDTGGKPEQKAAGGNIFTAGARSNPSATYGGRSRRYQPTQAEEREMDEVYFAADRSAAPKKEAAKYLCPHCREGTLQRIRGSNGLFWGCSNYPHCTATYDDERGEPALTS